MERIEFRRLKSGSIFRIGYLALLGFVMPLCLLFGLLALAGADTVTLNGRYVHGFGGLAAALALGLGLPAILAGFMVVGSLVVRAVGRLAPKRAAPGDPG
ncbi:MAG TPA: hypothetical protein VEA61_07455 [Allosphingosinicella sp.]|nr:hypothetical protein [Allosphingosinicella sp.]